MPGWGDDNVNLEAIGAWSWDDTGQSNSTGWDQPGGGQSAFGWGMQNSEWGGIPTGNDEPQHEAPPERKASTSSRDIPTPVPQEDLPKRPSISIPTWEQSTAMLIDYAGVGRTASVSPTELSSTMSATRLPRFTDPMLAFKATLKILQQAVRRQTEYDQASSELDQWRRTRNSEEFARATLETRKKLEAKRLEIGQKQSDAEKKLKAAVDGLAEFPDLSAPEFGRVQYAFNEAEMARFQIELKEWIRQVNQHPIVQGKEPEKSVTPEDPFLRDPNEWTSDDIRLALTELENHAEHLSDLVYSPVDYASLGEEAKIEIHTWKEQLVGNVEKQVEGVEGLLAPSEEQQRRVESALADRAEKVASLLQEEAALQSELAASQALQDSLDKVLVDLTSMVEQYEQFKIQDAQDIAELTRLIQTTIVPRRPPQVKLTPEEILPHLRATIIPHLQDEVLPIVECFMSETLQHDRKIQGMVNGMSDDIANKMDSVKISAQALMNASEPQI
ncbi:hypothetical protein AX15_005520 [Amanita polypyramis BW_CC]|nr:hypothetical protein AX15_005520 [Amanita polypyramis BW_CC]